ncbi:hypothetical protein WJX82_002113 [Trebouxia sp. C0006]
MRVADSCCEKHLDLQTTIVRTYANVLDRKEVTIDRKTTSAERSQSPYVNQGSQSAEPSTQGDRGATGARYWQPSQHSGNKQVKPDEPAVDRRILASRLAPVVTGNLLLTLLPYTGKLLHAMNAYTDQCGKCPTADATCCFCHKGLAQGKKSTKDDKFYESEKGPCSNRCFLQAFKKATLTVEYSRFAAVATMQGSNVFHLGSMGVHDYSLLIEWNPLLASGMPT